MLTLKVFTTDINDQTTAYILSADSISHKEYFSNDHHIVSKTKVDNDSIWIIGEMQETDNTQKFIVSEIYLYDEERNCKNILLVLPKSSCYIMENGKTVDSYHLNFEE